VTRLLTSALAKDPSAIAVVDGDDVSPQAGGARPPRVLDRAELNTRVFAAAHALLGSAPSLAGARIAVVVPPGIDWLTWTLAVMRTGGAAVPLLTGQPESEVAHALDEARVTHVVTTRAEGARLLSLLDARGIASNHVDDASTHVDDALEPSIDRPWRAPEVSDDALALVLFTSGTTGKPKAAGLSRRAVDAQVSTLLDAWKWSAADHILAFLPLHHVHGIVNVLFSSLCAGAKTTMLYPFDAERVWRRLLEGDVTVFMAVPTIWKRMLAHRDAQGPDEQRRMREVFSRMRLAVSGSAALDAPTFERIALELGTVPLERYGMTEIGMALSNPYDGVREKGTVGFPLPGVAVRLVDDEGRVVVGGEAVGSSPIEGLIEVQGATLFSGYLFRDDVTRASFADDGWFKTGDFARRSSGRYTILGRRSSDILKTGGEKVSALEIESALVAHESIRAVAVVGLPHAEWGQEVVAVVEQHDGAPPLTRDALRAFAKGVLSTWKVPRRLFVTDALPVNALGKVQKAVVVERVLRAVDGASRDAHETMREVLS
jgi:malonyl-CoA/methylmalonyl-CoA synthetase